MALNHGFCSLWVLMAAVMVSPQKTFDQRAGLNSECLGNVMRFTLDKSLVFGSHLQLEAMNGSQSVPLTPGLAVKCGYSMDSDPWGNTKIYASLLSCFTQNHDDESFNIGLRLRMYGHQKSVEDVHEVRQTCEYPQWVSREIICERNFMEVSVYRLPPEAEDQTRKQVELNKSKGFKSPTGSEVSTSLQNVWRLVFYTPKEKPMTLMDALSAGYGISTSPSRLVLRSPYNTPETYTQNVNGVQMEVFKVMAYFKRDWSVTMIETVAACPTGGLHFTEDLITWYMPLQITPLTSNYHENLELYMGIDGKKLTTTQMKDFGYVVSLTESHIIVSLPVGGPNGYYKSHALDYKYHITYSIEPMLEMVWKDEKSVTKYRVHYPISTLPQPPPAHIIDDTVAELGVFNVALGTFLSDVELINITFSTGVMTVSEANFRGFNVQQHIFPNGSKTFSIQVPFSDTVVMKASINLEMITYTLPLIFGLLILPEHTPFPHPALLEATRQDITLPIMTGICDEEKFHVTITYGNQGKNFNVHLGRNEISHDHYREYNIKENSTHMSMAVSYLARDVIFEFAHQSSIRGRLDVQLWDPVNSWHLKNFSLACSFPLTMIECFSNGSMTALAVKVESASKMIPRRLRLTDPSCTPTFSNDRFAYFSFNARSCGTTRKFYDGVMVYQNEISMGGRRGPTHQDVAVTQKGAGHAESEYRVSVACYYTLNDSQSVMFLTVPQGNTPLAETGVGELQVSMQLSKDGSYSAFYVEDDYPVVQYLKEPLYFEVDLIQSTDPRIELVLDNCWASDGVSSLNWNLIVNGCMNPDDRYQTIFHPVSFDDRVQYPAHVKRFEVKMFTFVKDDVVLRDQVFVHCEAVICDLNQKDEVCRRQCPMPMARDTKRVRRGTASDQLHRMQVTSGEILLSRLKAPLFSNE